MTSDLPFFGLPGVFGWWSGHNPPRRIFIVEKPPETFDWGVTENQSDAKVFPSLFGAQQFYLSKHTFPQDYAPSLTTSRFFWLPAAPSVCAP